MPYHSPGLFLPKSFFSTPIKFSPDSWSPLDFRTTKDIMYLVRIMKSVWHVVGCKKVTDDKK